MSNLRKWKKAGKEKAIEFREARKLNNGERMREIQKEIGIKKS